MEMYVCGLHLFSITHIQQCLGIYLSINKHEYFIMEYIKPLFMCFLLRESQKCMLHFII